MKKILIITSFILIAAATLSVSAQTKTRVKFPAGTHGTTVSGTVRGYAYRDYIVGSREGQTMTVSLTTTGNPAVFTIFNPDGSNLDGGAETDKFTGELPASGDFVVRVLMMRNEARHKGSASNYTLKISVK